jgi:hypothetical protein
LVDKFKNKMRRHNQLLASVGVETQCTKQKEHPRKSMGVSTLLSVHFEFSTFQMQEF